VLHHTGVLDNLRISNKHDDLIGTVTGGIAKSASSLRAEIHRKLNPRTMKSFFETERMGAFGLAGGAFLGMIL
jgi:hypothetical protein